MTLPPPPMTCRNGCAACCIAPSISTPIPGLHGAAAASKPAGVRCVQLDNDLRCRLFGHPERPAVCGSLQPVAEMCGANREEAIQWLSWLERETST